MSVVPVLREWAEERGLRAALDASAPSVGVVQAAQAASSIVLGELLAVRRFDIRNPPPKADPRYRLKDASIATPGNLVALQAQAKQGKTAAGGAMMGATMNPTGDCLGFTSDNNRHLAVLHFDTEQSPADHHGCVLTTLRRAGCTEPPPWFRSYRLADISVVTRRQMIAFELDRAKSDHGGLHSVFLDGLADFIIDPNDSAEAFGFIDELHQLAIKFETVIICVLHENPGSETGKTRGHLGSQLERKAETNLRLAKDGETVIVFTEKARHASIPKDRGPRFHWDDEEMMHVSIAGTGADTRASEKHADLEELAAAVYQHVPVGIGMSWVDLLGAIGDVLDIKKEGAKRHYKALKIAGLIHKKDGKWIRR
jgi:hypothetical protein